MSWSEGMKANLIGSPNIQQGESLDISISAELKKMIVDAAAAEDGSASWWMRRAAVEKLESLLKA